MASNTVSSMLSFCTTKGAEYALAPVISPSRCCPVPSPLYGFWNAESGGAREIQLELGGHDACPLRPESLDQIEEPHFIVEAKPVEAGDDRLNDPNSERIRRKLLAALVSQATDFCRGLQQARAVGSK